MEFPASELPTMNSQFSNQDIPSHLQLQWNQELIGPQPSQMSDLLVFPEGPYETGISLEHISELISTYESNLQPIPKKLNPEYTTCSSFNYPSWPMNNNSAEGTVSGVENNYELYKPEYPFMPIPSSSSTVYRNGFGDPITFQDYPSDMAGNYDCGSSPPPLSTTSESSSELHYSAYGYPMSSPAPTPQPINQFNFGTSSAHCMERSNSPPFRAVNGRCLAPMPPIKKHRLKTRT
ncbi:hypothetical protein BY996DRAFT_6413718 [Phakopsora pachyrhizi]|nr:hypothetical protein BY996DRAFT_6413718 [Phakopsora pachyrhizi]